MVVLELDDGERAVFLDEFAHQRSIGIERVAADQFAVECALRQAVHQRLREGFLVAGTTMGELREGFARGGIT